MQEGFSQNLVFHRIKKEKRERDKKKNRIEVWNSMSFECLNV